MECIYCAVQNRNCPICIRKLALLPMWQQFVCNYYIKALHVSVRQNVVVWVLELWLQSACTEYPPIDMSPTRFTGFAWLAFKHSRLTAVLYVRKVWGKTMHLLFVLSWLLDLQCISFIGCTTIKCTSLCILMLPLTLWLIFLFYFWLMQCTFHASYTCLHAWKLPIRRR